MCTALWHSHVVFGRQVIELLNKVKNHLTAGIVSNDNQFLNEARPVTPVTSVPSVTAVAVVRRHCSSSFQL